MPLVGRTIAEIGEAQPAVLVVLVRKGQSAAKRDLRADDAVAAVEFVLGAEHVHRTALAARNPRRAAGQFGHDDLGIDAVGEHVAVIAIAGDDAVPIRVERRLQPDRHRFLTDIEVAKPADQAEAVKLAGLFLEPADQ